MAFDAANNLYVANNSGKVDYSVTVYAPGSNGVLEKIKDGVNAPYALAFDKSGTLYVANLYSATVTLYASGSTTPFRTLSEGIEFNKQISLQARRKPPNVSDAELAFRRGLGWLLRCRPAAPPSASDALSAAMRRKANTVPRKSRNRMVTYL